MTPIPEPTQCHEALDWLQRQLDGESKPMPNAVAGHIATCAECRDRIRAADLLIHAFDKKPAMRRLPAERIVLAVQRDRRRRRATRWVAAAVSLAAAVVLGVWLTARPTTDPQLPELAKAPSLREGAAEATEALVAISRRATAETLGESRLLVPKVELPSVAVTALASAATPINDAGKGLMDGLEPVASSARRAIGMFMKDGHRGTTSQN